jgi:putative addiction module CopG family antidote
MLSLSDERNLASKIGLNSTPQEALMCTNQQFSITLPKEMAEIVKTKVARGEYATESEVIRNGLQVLMARDRAIDNGLRQEVSPTYDALKKDLTSAVNAEQVRNRLKAEHEKCTTKA